jgi:magnesium chelatase family protein
MNLCPCGARGDPGVECGCSPQRLSAYREKLSRALLDRFDLVVHLPRARSGEVAGTDGEPSAEVAERVVVAAARVSEEPPPLGEAAWAFLARAVDSLGLSARGHARVSRVAVTIAALARVGEVTSEHVAEALSYRSPRELCLGA